MPIQIECRDNRMKSHKRSRCSMTAFPSTRRSMPSTVHISTALQNSSAQTANSFGYTFFHSLRVHQTLPSSQKTFWCTISNLRKRQLSYTDSGDGHTRLIKQILRGLRGVTWLRLSRRCCRVNCSAHRKAYTDSMVDSPGGHWCRRIFYDLLASYCVRGCD